MCGVMREDEDVISTGHIAIGTRITLGDLDKAPIHYDFLLRDSRVIVDGHAVIDGTEVFIG